MQIWNFPSPVLSQITSYLGQSLLRLWISGDRALRHHLSQEKGVTDVLLTNSFPDSTSLWPAVLGSCRFLVRLRIMYPASNLGCPEYLWDQISSLHYLKSIDIRCNMAEFIFMKPTDPNNLSAYQWPSTPGVLQLRCLEEVFPELESLSISTSHYYISNEHIKHLPRSLVSFRLPMNCLLTKECIPDLPPNLTELQIILPSQGPIDKPWPETLENLELLFNFTASLASIPPNLTALNIHTRSEVCWANMPSLKSLIMVSTSPAPLALLTSPKLTLLQASLPIWTEDHLRNLPHSLTSLECSGAFTSPSFEFIPPFLQHLILREVKYLRDDMFTTHPLPKSLQTLELSARGGEVTQHFIPLLPASLRRLCIFGVDRPNLSAEVPVPASWPPTLTHISLPDGFPINLASVKLLPPSVSHLRVQITSNLPAEYEALQTLMSAKEGNLSTGPFSVTPYAFSAPKLPFLRNLHLTSSGSATFDACSAVQGLQKLMLPNMLLNRLQIRQLPSQLVALVVLGNHWQDDDIQWLPRTLTDITFNRLFPSSSSDFQLTSACFRYLPRTLRQFELCLANLGRVPDEDLIWLPRTLISLAFIHGSGPGYYLLVQGREHLLPCSMFITHIGYAHGKLETILKSTPPIHVRPHPSTKFSSFWNHNFFD